MGSGAQNGDHKDDVGLLTDQDGHGEAQDEGNPGNAAKEMQDVQELQAELTHMQSQLWENEEMTDEEAEELERQAVLLKIKMTRASERIKQWGMETGLSRLESFQKHTMSREDEDGNSLTLNEKEVLYKLLPIAFIFMCLVFGASTVHFDDSVPIPGHLFPIAPGHPVMWPMGSAEAMVEARIQIQSSSEPGGGGGGHHRRRTGPSDYKHSFLHNNHKWNRGLRSRVPPPSAAKRATTVQRIASRPAAAPQVPRAAAGLRKLLQNQPPPPELPEGWQAVWDQEHQMYYYWDTATDYVTWDLPALDSPAPPPAAPAPEHGDDDSTQGTGHGTGEEEEQKESGHGAAGEDEDHEDSGDVSGEGAGHGDMHAGGDASDGEEHSEGAGDGHGSNGGMVHGDDGHGADAHDDEHVAPIIDIYLFEFNNMDWQHCDVIDLACIRASASDEEVLGQYKIKDEEQAILMEFHLKDDSKDQYFIVISEHPEPLAIAINMHSLGSTGASQVFISAVIMVALFGMIMTEVLHRTMAAMIGAAMCMIMLAVQNRVPSLSKVVGWMDHGTLGLLWGMMLIVGITMRTGVFEWTGVLACKLSKGDKTQLLLLLCAVTAVLSAFLDNVTTILLIAPVTCKLCKLVKIDPRPYLISEAIFSNVGGTATMIGDPPNIIIGNMLAKYLDFNAFLFNLGPGVILTSPPVFYYLVHYFKDNVVGELVVDIPKLERMYPITDRPLLIKCGVVLACVIMSFFLHPITHLDPAWIAIMGAVWLLVAFDMHHCHEALMAVEWDTLLFFAALFVVVEGVSEMGLLRFIATTLSSMVEGIDEGSRQYFSIWLIMWASAVFSAFVDNIPFTATMVPVMMQMVEAVDGISIRPLAWALAFGACFGGNGTLIGASANIVMASKAETEGYHISFMDFFKVGFPVMLISVACANVYLFLLNAFFWQATAGEGGGLLTNAQLAAMQ